MEERLRHIRLLQSASQQRNVKTNAFLQDAKLGPTCLSKFLFEATLPKASLIC